MSPRRSERSEPTVSVERVDPARTGVSAGRIVGLLTAALAVATVVWVEDSFYAGLTLLLDAVGLGFAGPVLFWGTVLSVAASRYALCYVLGSLIGVVYDWLDRPSPLVLVVVALGIGLVEGVAAFLDTFRPLLSGAYVLAWLCYVPAFVWLFDGAKTDDRTGTRRSENR